MTAEPARVTRVAAYAVCADERRRILLCRIAPGSTRDRDGWWTLPGGGVDHGEHPSDAVLRELREETGLAGEVVELLEVDSWNRLLPARDRPPRPTFTPSASCTGFASGVATCGPRSAARPTRHAGSASRTRAAHRSSTW
jgi:8-oxo-dGTP pyrophosphatase MutT (NUDIX family)